MTGVDMIVLGISALALVFSLAAIGESHETRDALDELRRTLPEKLDWR